MRTRSWKPSAAWSSRGRCRARVSLLCRCQPSTEVHTHTHDALGQPCAPRQHSNAVKVLITCSEHGRCSTRVQGVLRLTGWALNEGLMRRMQSVTLSRSECLRTENTLTPRLQPSTGPRGAQLHPSQAKLTRPQVEVPNECPP